MSLEDEAKALNFYSGLNLLDALLKWLAVDQNKQEFSEWCALNA